MLVDPFGEGDMPAPDPNDVWEEHGWDWESGTFLLTDFPAKIASGEIGEKTFNNCCSLRGFIEYDDCGKVANCEELLNVLNLAIRYAYAEHNSTEHNKAGDGYGKDNLEIPPSLPRPQSVDSREKIPHPLEKEILQDKPQPGATHPFTLSGVSHEMRLKVEKFGKEANPFSRQLNSLKVRAEFCVTLAHEREHSDSTLRRNIGVGGADFFYNDRSYLKAEERPAYDASIKWAEDMYEQVKQRCTE